ncbi:MAG TPA: lipid II flippase MurJ, partial [Acidimicrobiales bacterium]
MTAFDPEATGEVPPPSAAGLARSTAAMTVLTAASRATGFIRVIVVVAVLGNTFLGNVYQSANTVPNILFELIAAGILQAVLIPSLVRYLDKGDKAEAEHIAGSVLGFAFLALAAAAAVGMALSPLISRLLFSGTPRAVRSQQIHLGTIFLLIFLPQVAMYAAGLVATGVLNARNRFATPVIAPAINNLVVISCYVAFGIMRHHQAPSLDLTVAQVVVLAGGTTFGVVAFSFLPVLSVMRSDFSLRPRLDRHHPEVRRIAKLGIWAAVFLAVEQVLLVVVLILSNRLQGGVVAYQTAYTFFTLPHDMFALAVITALFPAISRHVANDQSSAVARSIERGSQFIALFALPATIGLIALSPALTRGVLFGKISGGGAQDVARALVGFAPGLLAYGLFLFLARVMYAQGDTRTPALVNALVTVGGSIAMLIVFPLVSTKWKVPALTLCHSAAYT